MQSNNKAGTREKVFGALSLEEELGTASLWRLLPSSFRHPRSGMGTITVGYFAFCNRVPCIAQRLKDIGPFHDGSYLIRFGNNPVFVWKVILERDGY